MDTSNASQVYKPNTQGQVDFDGDNKIDATIETDSLELGEETYETSNIDSLIWIDDGDGIYNAEKDQVLIIKDNKVYNPEGEEVGQLDTSEGTIKFSFEGKTYYGLCDKDGNWNVCSSTQPDTNEAELVKTDDNNYVMTIAGSEYAVTKGKDNKGNSCFVISNSEGETVGFMEIGEDGEPALGSMSLEGESYVITNLDGEIKYTKDELSDNSELLESSISENTETETEVTLTQAEIEELGEMTDAEFESWLSSFSSDEELTAYMNELNAYYESTNSPETKDLIGEICGEIIILKSEDGTLDAWVHSLSADEFNDINGICACQLNWPNPDQDNATIGYNLMIQSLCKTGNEKQAQEVLQILLDEPYGENITVNIFSTLSSNGNLEGVLAFDELGLSADEITTLQEKVLEDFQDIISTYEENFSDESIASVVNRTGASTTETTAQFSATVNGIISTAGAVVGALDNLGSSAYDNVSSGITTDSTGTQSLYPSKINPDNYQSYSSLDEATINSLLTYLFDDLTSFENTEDKVVFATMLEVDLYQVCDDINKYSGDDAFSSFETWAETNASATTVEAINIYKASDEYPGDSEATVESFDIWIRSQGPGLEPNKSYGTDTVPTDPVDPPEDKPSFKTANVKEAIYLYLFGPEDLFTTNEDSFAEFESWANDNPNYPWSEDLEKAIEVYKNSDEYSSDSTVEDFTNWVDSL